MVGDGNGGQPAAAGEIDDLGRGIQAVAVRGVQVQVGSAGVRSARELLAQVGERLAGWHHEKRKKESACSAFIPRSSSFPC